MQKKKLAYPHLYFEKKAWADNDLVCGIDEAGRGALAGPLVVGSAIIPVGTKHPLLQDSKKLSEKQREEAFSWIQQHCSYAYALCSEKTIDNINIYQATLQTMRQAFLHLESNFHEMKRVKTVLIDAMPLTLPTHSIKIAHFNYGESISPSIAAASIVAKVVRDRIMKELAQTFPAYDFVKHKGYGTAQHTQAIKKFGPSLVHRKTFITKVITDTSNESVRNQQSLF